MRIVWVLIFVTGFLNISVFAQKTKIWTQSITLSTERESEVRADEVFNGLTIIFEEVFISGLKIITPDGKIYELTQDEHVEDRIQANLVFLSKPINLFKIIGNTERVNLKLIYQFVPSVSMPSIDLEQRAVCESPAIVPQSVWRAGLEPPVPGRSKTTTRHCIVHHSASSNTDTNSINLVRAFYIQHKDINGWDDIGYNYLIGHDGVVFAGRDPEKEEIDQDNVFGAHFCGKNSFTMGVCVIGNFEDEAPDERAVESLEQLLTWKMYKDQMDALDSLHHLDTINGDLLPVLAGHRNGCATECPGQLLFDQLPHIRTEVAANIESCGPLSNSVLPHTTFKMYPNPSGNELFIEIDEPSKYEILNVAGIIVKSGNTEVNVPVDLSGMNNGLYFVRISGKWGFEVEKMMKVAWAGR